MCLEDVVFTVLAWWPPFHTVFTKYEQEIVINHVLGNLCNNRPYFLNSRNIRL